MENEEIWGTYPEFDWIQASNLGRYRAITREVIYKNGAKHTVKGRNLKTYRDKYGYLRLNLKVNGKTVNRQAHRVTAMTFIPNPENLPQVNHKNCIRDDNRVENLEWCSQEYNNEYREKYGLACNRPVYAFNLKIQKLSWFRSRSEAGRELGIDQGDIWRVIVGQNKQAGGYWFTEDKSKINKDKLSRIIIKDTSKRPIIAINLETQEPLRFESQHEAARQLEANVGHINSVIKGKLKQTGGYWFTNADGNVVETTRAKLGDNVANKVSKLIGA